MKCKTQGCGSYAINHSEHGRDGSDPDLCDVCYWRTRAETAHEQLEAIGAGGVSGPLMSGYSAADMASQGAEQFRAGQAAVQTGEDAKLLDWLGRAGPTSICLVMDREHDGLIEVSHDGPTGYGKTLRAAIKAAIAAQQGDSHE